MPFKKFAVSLAHVWRARVAPALADCNISDAQLEEAILEKPEFQDPDNRRLVSRSAHAEGCRLFVVGHMGWKKDCERVIGNVRQLIAAPEMGQLGSNERGRGGPAAGSDGTPVNTVLASCRGPAARRMNGP